MSLIVNSFKYRVINKEVRYMERYILVFLDSLVFMYFRFLVKELLLVLIVLINIKIILESYLM